MRDGIHRKLQVRQGFTLIEMMVVVGVMLVLMGILFIAGQRVIASNRLTSTRATLLNLQGMLNELDATNGLRTQPTVWLWTNGTAISQSLPGRSGLSTPTQTLTQEFWKTPSFLAAGPPVIFDSLASPGLVIDDGALGTQQRNGSIAIVNTSLAMSLLAAIPANRSALQALPQQQQFAITWQGGSSMITLPGTDQWVGTMDDQLASVQYVAGAHVRLMDTSGGTQKMRYYYAPPGFPPENPKPDPAAKEWKEETAAPFHAPLALDAWSNPIIFVPASGLRVRLLNGESTLDPSLQKQNWIVVSTEGAVINNGSATATPQVTQPGRPFFASAGPDGDFTTGDDNVYSFEK